VTFSYDLFIILNVVEGELPVKIDDINADLVALIVQVSTFVG
jgi:hypothetical protein